VTTFKDRIKADITEAMRAREEAKLSTLRMVLSAIQNAEVAGDEAIVLTDDQVIKVLQSEAKKRAESAQILCRCWSHRSCSKRTCRTRSY
jgi:uncharacterized protein YqeY